MVDNSVTSYYRIHHSLKSKPCGFCNRIFTPSKSNTEILCSRRCKIDSLHHRQWKLKPICCIGCKKEFLKTHSSQIFCSPECRSVYGYKQEKKRIVIKKCPTCNKEFETQKMRQKYCSPKCRITFNYLIHRKPKVELEKICLVCNSSFKTTIPKKKYCSFRCLRKQSNRNKRGGLSSRSRMFKKPCEFCNFSDLRAIHRHHIKNGNVICLCANHHYIFHSIVGWNGTSEDYSKDELLETLKVNYKEVLI